MAIPRQPLTLEERVKKLEDENAAIVQALRSYGGQVKSIRRDSSLQEVIDGIRTAGGQILGYLMTFRRL